MKRVALAGVLALLVVLVPTKLEAQTTSDVTFVNASPYGPLDLYIGPDGGATVSLAAPDVAKEAVLGLGSLESGSYHVLICGHVASPAPTIDTCLDNTAPTFEDQKLKIAAGGISEVVFGLNANGSPRLSKLTVDTGCTSPGGRLQFANVAESAPAVATLDGTVIDDNLGSGKAVKVSASAGTHTLAATDGAALNISVPVDIASQTDTIAYLSGTPNGYAVVAVHQVALDCGSPAPTDGSTTGTDPAAVNANTTTTGVSPRFTG